MNPEDEELQSLPGQPANMSVPITPAAPVDPGTAAGMPVPQVAGQQAFTPNNLSTRAGLLQLAGVSLRPSGPGIARNVTQTTTSQQANPIDPKVAAQATMDANVLQGTQEDEARANAQLSAQAGQMTNDAAQARNAAAMAQQGEADRLHARMAEQTTRIDQLLNTAQQPAVRGQFLDRGGFGARASVGLGLLFSALQGGAMGDPQNASNYLQGLVNQDLEDQIRERENTYANAGARQNLVGMFEQELGSRQAATEAARAAMLGFLDEKLQAMQLGNIPEQTRQAIQVQRATIAAERSNARAAAAQASAGTVERTETMRTTPGGSPWRALNYLAAGSDADNAQLAAQGAAASRNGGNPGDVPIGNFVFPVGSAFRDPTITPPALRAEIINDINNSNNIERLGNQLIALGAQGRSFTPDERASRAAATRALLSPLLRAAQGAGAALGEDERQTMDTLRADPTAIFERNAEVKLRALIDSTREALESRVRDLGGRRAGNGQRVQVQPLTPPRR